MPRYKVKKKLTAWWFDVEGKSTVDASIKARKLVPDRQVVTESHAEQKK